MYATPTDLVDDVIPKIFPGQYEHSVEYLGGLFDQ